MNRFWNNEIRHKFADSCINYKVRLANGRRVRHVNLDNAATTPPFKSVMNNLETEFHEYASVHRGAGRKSQLSTERYEASRQTIRRFVNGRISDYVIFTPNTTVGINQLAYFFSYIKGKVLVADIEHSSSFLPWVFQEGRQKTIEQVSLKDALHGNTSILNKDHLFLCILFRAAARVAPTI